MKKAWPLAAIVACLIAGCGGGSHPSHKPYSHKPYGHKPYTHQQVTTAGQTATGSVHPPGWGAPLPGHPNGLTSQKPTLTQTATMYDSVTLGTVPSNPFALAGYVGGSWPTYLPMRHTWPKAHTISIAVNASEHADCLDVEPGDADWSQVPGWIAAERRDTGLPKAVRDRPCLYSSLSPWETDGFPTLRAHGISTSSVFKWDADYTFSDHLDSGFDATQWTDSCLGRNLDCSRVTLNFLSIATPPYSTKPPGPSSKTITHWRSARNSSFSAYHKHGCTNGLVHDTIHRHDDCFKFAQRVVYFQRQLWTKVPGNKRFHVFGPLARTKTPIGWILRPTANLWSKALNSTEFVISTQCSGPVSFPIKDRSKHCRTLRARVKYYQAHLKSAYGLKPFVY